MVSFSLAHSDGTKQSSLLIPGTCLELPLFAISSPKAINTRTDSSATLTSLKHAVGFATASDLKLLLSRSIGVLLMSMFYSIIPIDGLLSDYHMSNVDAVVCMCILSYIYNYIKAFCF